MEMFSYTSISHSCSKRVNRNISAGNKAFLMPGKKGIRPSSHCLTWLLWSVLEAELVLWLFSPSNPLRAFHSGSPLDCAQLSCNADKIYHHSHLCSLPLSAKFRSSTAAAPQTPKGHGHICAHTNTFTNTHVHRNICRKQLVGVFFIQFPAKNWKKYTILKNIHVLIY